MYVRNNESRDILPRNFAVTTSASVTISSPILIVPSEFCSSQPTSKLPESKHYVSARDEKEMKITHIADLFLAV